MTRTALVVAGGAKPCLAVQAALGAYDYCVAADSGADHAIEIGAIPDVVVGDLDSISSTLRKRIESGELSQVEIESYSTTKDMTDLELALRRAVKGPTGWAPDRVTVVGIDGGRPDHYLANLLAISSPDLLNSAGDDGFEIEALFGATRLSVVRSGTKIAGDVGDLLTLLPVHGPVTGIVLSGVEYPLRDETLVAGSARGVSNVLTSTSAELTIEAGILLVFQPNALARDLAVPSTQPEGYSNGDRSKSDSANISGFGDSR